MELILNERKHAEELLETGNVGRKPSAAVTLLVRYYYHIHGLRRKKILAAVDEFMTVNYPGWNMDEWLNTITRYINTAKKYPLLELDQISVSSTEMEVIKSVQNEQCEKLLFASVCAAKYYYAINELNNGWVNVKLPQLFKMANQSGSKRDKLHRVYDLRMLNTVSLAVRGDSTNFHVDIIDNLDEAYKIYRMTDLGNEYMVLTGRGLYCEKCGRYEKQNKNKTKKYCKQCAAPSPTRMIVCEDCGNTFEISNKNSQTTRCPDCYAEHRKARKLETQRLRRAANEVRPSEVDFPDFSDS